MSVRLTHLGSKKCKKTWGFGHAPVLNAETSHQQLQGGVSAPTMFLYVRYMHIDDYTCLCEDKVWDRGWSWVDHISRGAPRGFSSRLLQQAREVGAVRETMVATTDLTLRLLVHGEGFKGKDLGPGEARKALFRAVSRPFRSGFGLRMCWWTSGASCRPTASGRLQCPRPP